MRGRPGFARPEPNPQGVALDAGQATSINHRQDDDFLGSGLNQPRRQRWDFPCQFAKPMEADCFTSRPPWNRLTIVRISVRVIGWTVGVWRRRRRWWVV